MNQVTVALRHFQLFQLLNIHYPGARRVVKNYPGSLLPGYPMGTRVPAAALIKYRYADFVLKIYLHFHFDDRFEIWLKIWLERFGFEENGDLTYEIWLSVI